MYAQTAPLALRTSLFSPDWFSSFATASKAPKRLGAQFSDGENVQIIVDQRYFKKILPYSGGRAVSSAEMLTKTKMF